MLFCPNPGIWRRLPKHVISALSAVPTRKTLMSIGPFYSERRNGPPSRTVTVVPEHVHDAFTSLVQRKGEANWLAQEYAALCPEGDGIAGTDFDALSNDLRVHVGCRWPVSGFVFEDPSLFSLLEFAALRAALPVLGREHTYYNHHELTFKTNEGQKSFRGEVNALFRSAGLAYEMEPNLKIERLAAPETEQVLDRLRANSGDDTLDGLIGEGRNLFRSRNFRERRRALEKLWDGFERLKSIDIPGEKKASVAALLAHISDDEVRAVVEDEMRALSSIGNEFEIRHWETGKHPVSDEAVEYFGTRMANIIVTLLRSSGRLEAP